MSANQNFESQQILSLQIRLKVEKSGQFVKDFIPNSRIVFSFLLCRLTPEAMGIGGLRERSLSPSDKVNAGAKTAECTSAANGHRRVLGVRSLVSKFVFRPLVYAKSLFVATSACIFRFSLFDRQNSRKVNGFS